MEGGIYKYLLELIPMEEINLFLKFLLFFKHMHNTNRPLLNWPQTTRKQSLSPKVYNLIISNWELIWKHIWYVILYYIIYYNNKLTTMEGKHTKRGVDIQGKLNVFVVYGNVRMHNIPNFVSIIGMNFMHYATKSGQARANTHPHMNNMWSR